MPQEGLAARGGAMGCACGRRGQPAGPAAIPIVHGLGPIYYGGPYPQDPCGVDPDDLCDNVDNVDDDMGCCNMPGSSKDGEDGMSVSSGPWSPRDM